MNMCGCACAIAFVSRAKNFGDQTEVIRLGGKYLCLLSHLPLKHLRIIIIKFKKNKETTAQLKSS